MAKQRVINTKYWKDPYIRSLDRDGKLLFLYLFTNDRTEMCGAYEITFDEVCFDTGLNAATVETLIAKFSKDKKYIYRKGWILCVNFIKNQRPNTSVLAGIRKSLERVPEWCATRLLQTVRNLNLNLNPNLNSNLNPKDSSIDESPEPKPVKKPRAKKALATIPDDFEITEGMRHWFSEHCPHIDIEKETKKFINRCTAKGTEYKDWTAGWRTQMQNAEDWATERNPQPKATTNGNAYDPKKDLLSPDYEMPSKPITFEDIIGLQRASKDIYPEKWTDRDMYETAKAPYTEKCADQIERYECSFEFGQRFGQAGQTPADAGTNARRG
jgi:hypothetical protein